MNKGTPINAVTTPTGRMVGDIICIDTISATTSNTAPTRPDAGIKNLLSPPITIRAMWGATNPMKPIAPVKQTMVDISKDASINVNTLTRSTFTPRLFADFGGVFAF